VVVEVTVGDRADSQRATIPELTPVAKDEPAAVAPAPAPAPAATAPLARPVPLPAPADRAPAGGAPHSLGWVIGGSGIALAGVGGAFYLLALSANTEAEQQCDLQGKYLCNSRALEAGERRDTYATIATIGTVAGFTAIGAGAWLLLTAPEPPRATTTTPRLVPALGPHAGSLVVKGAFP
jgi:hypothetical protein